MKKKILLLMFMVLMFSCKDQAETPAAVDLNEKPDLAIDGTWKLVYGEIKERDSLQIKDLSKSDFIKILNKDHFAFFNQPKDGEEGFYGGAGTYELNGNAYTETLQYIEYEAIRGHKFAFNVEVKGDTLIQSGVEDVPEAGIKRHIVEKYIRVE